MIRYLFLLFLFTSPLFAQTPPSSPAPNGIWITGQVFQNKGILFFKLDKPVNGNSTKDIVLLGTSTKATNLLPIYQKAAEKRMTLRLYGQLISFTGTPPPGYTEPMPNVQFITWKAHTPDEPDSSK